MKVLNYGVKKEFIDRSRCGGTVEEEPIDGPADCGRYL